MIPVRSCLVISVVMSKRHVSRRSVLQFAGGFAASLFAAKALHAKDRSVSKIKGPSEGLRFVEYSCNNTGVPTSEKTTRISLVEDFNSSSICEMTPRSFEGPYFYCGETPGKNITAGQIGEPLILALRVIDAKTCESLPGAIVDVWHTDAMGRYSGYDADPDTAAPNVPHLDPTNSDRWCRGALMVDEDGIAEFETIYPGHYFGRAIHIHYKIHLGNQTYVTNQTLLPESYNEALLSRPPYNVGRRSKRVPNAAEAGWGINTLKIIERDRRLVGVLTVAVAAV